MNCKQNEPWPKNSAPKTSYITFNDDDDDDHNENWNWVASCTLGTYLANGSVSIFGCKEWRCARTWLAASMVVAHLYAARLIIQPSIWRFTCDGWKLTVARIFNYKITSLASVLLPSPPLLLSPVVQLCIFILCWNLQQHFCRMNENFSFLHFPFSICELQ